MKKIIAALGILVFIFITVHISNSASYFPRAGNAQRYSSGGQVLVSSGAQVWVYQAGTTDLATLYSSSTGSSQTNPVIADRYGNYSYYASSGRYDEIIVGPAGTSPVNIYGVLIESGVSSSAWVDTKDYSLLTEAISVASNRGVGVLVSNSVTTITTGLTITVPVQIVKGGMLTTTTTVTLASFDAGNYKVFNLSAAGTVVFASGSGVMVIPQWFGAIGDGVSDDSDAIQHAVNSVIRHGGTVYFPTPAKYKITKQTNINSIHPVNLISDMTGASNNTDSTGSYFLIGSSWSGSVFKYYSPTANRYEGGGGTIRGLAFFDATYSYSVTSALDLYDFNFSQVSDCSFYQIVGSAIKTTYCVMSDFRNLIMRRCGDTSKPAFYIIPTDATYITQSVSIDGLHSEINNSAPYVSINQYAQEIKISNSGFEAAPATSASNQNFIYVTNAHAVAISNSHFNGNNATQINADANSYNVSISGSVFTGAGTTTTNPAILLAGTWNTVTGNSFWGSLKTADEITLSGAYNIVNGNSFRSSGGITSSAVHNVISNNQAYDLTTTNSYWIAGIDYNTITGNNLRKSTLDGTSGGIHISGTFPSATGNTIYNFVGYGMFNESSNATVVGNSILVTGGGTDYFTNAPLSPGKQSNMFLSEANSVSGPFALGSVASVPTYTGQLAVVSGAAYLATGTTSSANWQQSTAEVFYTQATPSTSVTGTTTETTLYSVTIPGGSIGPNGTMEIETLFTVTGSTNAKTVQSKLGATSVAWNATSTASIVTIRPTALVINDGNESSQIIHTNAITGQSSVSIGSASLATAGDLTLSITGQLASAGETITLRYVGITINRGD